MHLRNILQSVILATCASFVVSAQPSSVPSGTEITVRTNDSINAKSDNEGKIYTAVVERDVENQSGRVLIPRGAEAELTVRSAGNGEMMLDLESINVNGRRYVVSSSDEVVSGEGSREGVGKNKRTAKYVGGGALIGSVIGAIAGGGKGAAIGAATGAGAGAVGQTVTKGKSVKVPSESLLTFRLDQSLVLGRERRNRPNRSNR